MQRGVTRRDQGTVVPQDHPAGRRRDHGAQLPLFLGEPEDVASVIAFLASDEARFIGQVLRVDGAVLSQLVHVPYVRVVQEHNEKEVS